MRKKLFGLFKKKKKKKNFEMGVPKSIFKSEYSFRNVHSEI